MAINFTGISNQGNVAKNNRTPVEDSTTSKASVDANTSSSGGIMAEDTVKLSGAAQTLQNQESKINGLSDIDQQKVDQIKQAIASGNYKIDSQKLASNMASMDSLF
ncbi:MULTISPECIES: flagellar biosynthesis anti-sigma factor FlgM [Marinomonas]|jgi:negative regulator of flagellin synthesis FlgM|uniref:flagellar biosynthesis anti-sigma factor FlgM n=1 Tax=Marinomonas TaxID=28253 RepID=UPI001054762B|nr:flagellar biosynthesis anti-sigma factor FlgM [Marinomonas sp. KMM3893]